MTRTRGRREARRGQDARTRARRAADTGRLRRTRDRPVTNPFYTAGWVRSCLQDESGRTNRACDWPTRTCNASGSRADCAVSCRLPGQSRASLPAREDRGNTTGYVFRLRVRSFPPPPPPSRLYLNPSSFVVTALTRISPLVIVRLLNLSDPFGSFLLFFLLLFFPSNRSLCRMGSLSVSFLSSIPLCLSSHKRVSFVPCTSSSPRTSHRIARRDRWLPLRDVGSCTLSQRGIKYKISSLKFGAVDVANNLALHQAHEISSGIIFSCKLVA